MPRKKIKLPAFGTLVIIGCNGFIGKNVLKALETDTRYPHVIAVDYSKPSITLKKTRFYKLDLTAAMADVQLAEILKKEKAQTVIHAAMPASPMREEARAHELIAIGSYYIFNACAAAGVRKVVMASTSDVYGAHPENPNFLSESSTLRGSLMNRFIADKIDAEKQALRYQKKYSDRIVTIVRNATILGPTVNHFKARYLKRPVFMTMIGFDPLLQCVHEEDAMRAFLQCVHEDHPGIFNVGADGVLPLSRVIALCGAMRVPLTQMAFKALAQTLWLADISPAPGSYADFLRYLCIVDNRRLKKELGFKFRYTTKEALLSFVAVQRLKKMDLISEEAA